MSDTEIKSEESKPLSKAELIGEISRALRDRRAARSLSLEKVTQMIKIRLPYLQALEEGNWDQLPAEVFVRGFIRRYAGFLGLDGDKLIAPYVALSESPVEHREPQASERKGDFGRNHLVWGFLGVLLIIGFLKVIKQESSGPVKAVSAVPSNHIPPVEAPPVVAPVVSKVDGPKATLISHQIDVFSPHPLWIRVNASNKNFEGFIPSSVNWSWKGEGTFTIRLGHTKDVTLSFDGKSVALTENQGKLTLPAE